jgi:hypothetical protein
MPSPLLSTLTHFWELSETSGNRANALGAGGQPFVPGGTITKIAGQIVGGGQADQFGATYGDKLAISGATQIDFSGDFTMGLFVRMPNPNPGEVTIFGRGTWYDRFDFTLWSGSGSVSAFLGDGTTSPAVVPFAAPLSPSAYANNTIVHSTWVWIGVRHVVSTKTLTFYLGQAQSGGALKAVNRTYTGTIVDSTLPVRINGLDVNASPQHAAIAVQGVFYAPSALTDKNVTALYNLGQGLLPPFTSYPSEDSVPGLVTAARYAYNQSFTPENIGQLFMGHGQDTSLSPNLNVQHVTTNLQFGWVNARTSFTEGEGIEPSKHATVTIKASYFVEGDTAAIPLTFSGASTVVAAYGDVVYADAITNRVFFPNQNIRVLTYYATSGGIAYIPGNLQFTAGGRRGTGTDTTTNITTGDYTTDAGQYGFCPSVAKGIAVGTAAADMQVAVRGDSIAVGTTTYVGKLGINSGSPHLKLAVAGSRAYTVQDPAKDLAGTALCKESTVIVDQFGVNDLNLTERTFAQLVTDKTTLWTRWFGSGSVGQKLICMTITPITSAGSATPVAARLLNRGLWNAFLRSGGTNADFGTMSGRPSLVYRWDGSAWAASGSRSAGSGLPLDVYIIDTAAVTENTPASNDNLWSTSTAGGTKADCSTVSAGDGIHPDATESIAIASLLQTRYNAALAAPLPVTTSGDEDNMTLTTATTTQALTSGEYTKIGNDGDGIEVASVGGMIYLRTVAAGGSAPSATLTGIPLGANDTTARSYTLDGVDLWARAEGAPTLAVIQK